MLYGEWEPTPREIRASEKHIRWRKRLGDNLFPKMLEIASTSNIPPAFHLGTVLYLRNTKPTQDISQTMLNRLSGLNYPDFKSAHYALTYGQLMSVINLAQSRQKGETGWPVELYGIDFITLSIPMIICEALAVEEKTDRGLIFNPSLSLRVADVITRLRRSITGEFNPHKIRLNLETSFSDPQRVANLNHYVRLKLQTHGMPFDW